MQAAIGRIQLRGLSESVEARSKNAALLRGGMSLISGLRVPAPSQHIRHAYYKFYAFVEPSTLRSDWNRDRILSEITTAGVPCYSGSCSEVYLERAFESGRSRPPERLPVARELGETSLMFLVHPTLGPEQMARMLEVTAGVMRCAVR